MDFTPKANKRHPVKLSLALGGRPGAGKTTALLQIATAITKPEKVYIIDTEDRVHFAAEQFPGVQVFALKDHHPNNFLGAIDYAVKNGFECVVIDSFSDEWDGSNGVLQLVDSQGGDKIRAWGKLTPLHNKVYDAVFEPQIHTLMSVRLEDKLSDGVVNGRPGKVSTVVPTQRKDFPYKVNNYAEIDSSHKICFSKCLWDQMVNVEIPEVSQGFVDALLNWANAGKEKLSA